MSCLTLQARWVLPVDQLPIEGGRISIRAGRIVSIGGPSVVYSPPTSQGPVCDLGDVVLLPGLVNAHTHLEFSHLKQPLGRPGMQLPDWIRLAIGDRKRTDREPAESIVTGLAESLRMGTTMLGEIATASLASYRQDQPLPALALFGEVIGFSGARVDSVLAATGSRWIANSDVLMPSSFLGLSPHAPYTVHPKLLHGLVDLAINNRLPLAMHLAEAPEELRLLADGDGPFRQLLDERSMWDDSSIPRGTQALDYLKQLARAPRSLIVHGNYLATPELEFLAKQDRRMYVVYCPRTHAYFEHRPYRLAEMLALGVPVALGTDSRASSVDLSLLAEMRMVAQEHADISARQVVRLGTLAGAQALGVGESTGSLAPGKWADLTAIPCVHGCGNPYQAVVDGTATPVATWLRGKLAYSRL